MKNFKEYFTEGLFGNVAKFATDEIAPKAKALAAQFTSAKDIKTAVKLDKGKKVLTKSIKAVAEDTNEVKLAVFDVVKDLESSTQPGDELDTLGKGYPMTIGDNDYYYVSHNSRSLTTMDESGRKKIHPLEGLEFEIYPDYNDGPKEDDSSNTAEEPTVDDTERATR